MRPKLPSAERLLPYLKAIDSSRTYSNFGPLVSAFEDRLAMRFGVPAAAVATVANGTVGLTLALNALGARSGTLCVMPAWTFVASAHAATMAGMIPYFVDVDAATWAIDPEAIAGVMSDAPGVVGAVMPVVPFGRPIAIAAWDRFRARTGVPVVIDAATAFDALLPGTVPAVISLHATKVFGVGEGGLVISRDTALVQDVRNRSNFGFAGTREAATPAANGKLSEYHAAVGLAALDEWTEVRAEWLALARAYREALPESNRLRFQEGFGQSWIASTCVMSLANVDALRIAGVLGEAGIETRRWWGDGAHAHRGTEGLPRTPVPVTEALAKSTLALPFFRDLTPREIQRIADLIRETINPLVAEWSRPADLTVREPATGLTGYRHPAYAASLGEFGTPRVLPRSGGWLIERAVPGGPYHDAMGGYPLFSCLDWSGLKADVDALANDLVSVSLVTDPFGHYDDEMLRDCFVSKVVPYKHHFVADLRRAPETFVSRHHRYYANRALSVVELDRCDQPRGLLDEWLPLYDHLIERHQLRGIKAFSPQSFTVQLTVPGVVMLRARHGGQTVGAHLWCLQDDVVHSHLAAANRVGYDLNVSYALYWFALETFARQAVWINFGAGAGLNSDGEDGLSRFKRGWATGTRLSYFCGRILNREKYAAALTARGLQDDDYFPAYRKGEFA